MVKFPRVPRISRFWLILAILLSAGVAISELKSRRVQREDELREMAGRTEALAQEVAALISTACTELASISENPRLVGPSTTAAEQLAEMQHLGRQHRFVTELSLFDKTGYVIASTCFLPVSQDSTTWFEAAKNGRFTISRPVVAADGVRLNYAVYMPVRAELGSNVAVIRATVPFEQLCHLVATLGERIGGEFVMTDGFGNILAGCDSARALAPFSVRLPLAAMGEQGRWDFDHGRFRFVSVPLLPKGLLPGEAMRLLWLKPEA